MRRRALHGRYVFAEAADPRLFEHSNLDPFGGPTALYVDEATSQLGAAAAVDAGTAANGTISADPLYVSYPGDLYLSAGSPCIAAGTPVTDMPRGRCAAVATGNPAFTGLAGLPWPRRKGGSTPSAKDLRRVVLGGRSVLPLLESDRTSGGRHRLFT